MAIVKHRVYVSLEGEVLDANSPHIDIAMPTCQVILPDDFGSLFPNPLGLKLQSLTVTWKPPEVQTMNVNLGLTQITDEGKESPMARKVVTLKAESEPEL